MQTTNQKYSEILRLNKELGQSLNSNSYNIKVLSNSTVNMIKEILEYNLRSEGINANIDIGNYDNIVQDSQKCKDFDTIIIFWDLFNVVEGIHHRVELFDSNDIEELASKVEYEIDIVFDNLGDESLVILNEFSSLPFSNFQINDDNYSKLCKRLNRYITEKSPSNFRLVNIDKIISNIGFKKSFDMRYFYSSKSIYRSDFFKYYSNFVKPFIFSATGKSKKALILDCDNTLWGGVLGEDGFDSIEMSQETKNGSIFREIQNIILSLNNKGILLGICSKNNFDDVQTVIDSHPDMQIRNEHITINKTNWNDKATNLMEISEELNIGLDSIVFMDDSPFEVNLVKEALPDVKVLQRPDNLNKYPQMLRSNLDLFYNLSFTEEDKKKSEMYKSQVKRQELRTKSTSLESYLESLELKMAVCLDDDSSIPRISQMTQKTNQFNLTTKRYTEKDIYKFVKSESHLVYSFSVTDKFGDSGLTGLCIVKVDSNKKTAEIDTFLMSCRIIGRNLEYAFMDYLISDIKEKNISHINSEYIKTVKNNQVSTFFDNCSFILQDERLSRKRYTLNVKNYVKNRVKYVRIN